MAVRRSSDSDPEILPAKVAERLLKRASELDESTSQITDLRQAASEAGISQAAFDAALAELQAEKAEPPMDLRAFEQRRQVRGFAAVVFAILMAAGMVLFSMRITPSEAQAGKAITEQTVALRCLAAGDAAELIRPILNSETGTVVVAPGAPRILRIRGTVEEVAKAIALVDERDVACALPRTPPKLSP